MDRVEEVNELANIENDENVECPVDANFADDWRNSNISIPNNNHGLYLTQFLMDFGQILDSESYDQA